MTIDTASPAPAVELLQSRRSARQFLRTPMSAADIRAVLEDAQRAPSNSNTQPWVVHVVSEAKRDALAAELVRAFEEERLSPDFTADYGQDVYLQRSQAHAAVIYGTLGVDRSDADGRRDVVRDNLRFYGAPHVAFLFMPLLGDGVRTAGDIGMYAQNFLLSLTARGFHGIPQTILGMYADVVRSALDISDDYKLLFGISFGTADPDAPVNRIRMHRLPVEQSVVIHGFADSPTRLSHRGFGT